MKYLHFSIQLILLCATTTLIGQASVDAINKEVALINKKTFHLRYQACIDCGPNNSTFGRFLFYHEGVIRKITLIDGVEDGPDIISDLYYNTEGDLIYATTPYDWTQYAEAFFYQKKLLAFHHWTFNDDLQTVSKQVLSDKQEVLEYLFVISKVKNYTIQKWFHPTQLTPQPIPNKYKNELCIIDGNLLTDKFERGEYNQVYLSRYTNGSISKVVLNYEEQTEYNTYNTRITEHFYPNGFISNFKLELLEDNIATIVYQEKFANQYSNPVSIRPIDIKGTTIDFNILRKKTPLAFHQNVATLKHHLCLNLTKKFETKINQQFFIIAPNTILKPYITASKGEKVMLRTPVIVLKKGAKGKLNQQDGIWYRVRIQSGPYLKSNKLEGKEGWIHSSQLKNFHIK